MAFELREYQRQFVDAIRGELLAGKRSVLGQAPTGAGKTAIASYMLGTAAERQTHGLFLVHRRELIKQTIGAFDQVGIQYGVIANGFHEDPRPLVQLASVQSYANRMSRLAKPGLVLWDECHHLAASSWGAIFQELSRARHIGLTATPERRDGAGLGRFFEGMVKGPSVAWLIENKWLSPYRLYAPPGLSVKDVHTSMGDYVKRELVAAADKPTVTGDAIREYRRRCDGARAIGFAVTVEHSLHVVAQFNAAGIPAAHVDGETPIDERDETIEAFRRGEVRVLFNVDLFGEGFDLPAAECVIGLRPSKSLALVLQQWGRVLRPAPGKNFAVILDHAGNCHRHGLPDDERDWSLNGGASRKAGEGGSGGPATKRCYQCDVQNARAAKKCQACGRDFDTGGADVEFVAGDLVEVDAVAVRSSHRQEVYAADSLPKLIELGRKKRYRDPEAWAKNVFAARERKKQERARGL